MLLSRPSASHKTRFMLTALGMVIGTASLILVVTIGLTGKEYILREIQGIGANMMVAYYQGGSIYGTSSSDYLTLDDMDAIRRQVPGITSSSPMLELHDQIPVPGGKERDVLVLGVSSQYQGVRNLEVLAGRFFDESDVRGRSKVALITQNLAVRLYGSPDAAVGHEIRLQGLPFIIVGVFRERVDTFGQSEISEETILIPHTVARFFTSSDAVKQLFFSVADSREVPRATEQIHRILQSRHRPESVYKVDNLTQLLTVASKTANALTTSLLLISVLTLLVSGVGIMNIMLATVTLAYPGDRGAKGGRSHQFRNPRAVFDRSNDYFAQRRHAGHCHRAGVAVLVALSDGLSFAHLGLVGGHRGVGVVAGWRAVRNRSCRARGAPGSGGKLALRVGDALLLLTGKTFSGKIRSWLR